MSSNEAPQRPYLRARRRVRQRVDAGEPRNSYSSIPGFSFRSTPHFRATGGGTHNVPHPPVSSVSNSGGLFQSGGGFPFPPLLTSGGHHVPHVPPGFPLGNPFYRPIHLYGLHHLKDKLNLPNAHRGGFFNPHHSASPLLPPRSPGSGHPGRPLSGPRLLGPPLGYPRFPCKNGGLEGLRPSRANREDEDGERLREQNGNEEAPPVVVSASEKEAREDVLLLPEEDGGRCMSTSAKGSERREENVVERERDKENISSSASPHSFAEARPGNSSSKTEEESLIGNLLPRGTDISQEQLSVAANNNSGGFSRDRNSGEEGGSVCSASAAKLVYFKNLGHAHDSFFGLRDLLHGKLALAAAAYTTKTLLLRQSKMEPGLSLLGHATPDLHRNNNNNNNNTEHFKDALVSHFLKVRQEMNALRVSSKVTTTEDNEPMDLVRNNEDNSGASPRSTSSDAGLSSSSAGKEKSARLENIVSSIRLPPGTKKRKLYQPIQVDKKEDSDDIAEHDDEGEDPPESKKERMNPLVEHLSRVREKLTANNNNNNDENTDPDFPPPPPSSSSHHPPTQQPPLPPFGPPPALQFQYMEMARRFIQEQQDKITKETITKDILNETIHKNNNIANKLAEISPELQGLAEILKSEITASLAVIIESIVGRFLHARRTPLGPKIFPPPPPHMGGLPSEDSTPKFNFPPHSGPGDIPPPPLTPLHIPPTSVSKNSSTPSGRAPQVRDRAVSRNIGNPMSISSMPLVNTTVTTFSGLPPSLRPGESKTQQQQRPKVSSSNSSENDLEGGNLPEQDEALSLVVTPKKPKRHKVTDTRITPRTVSRVLGSSNNGDSSPNTPLFSPGLSESPLFPGLPTSVAIPNPSLSDFHRFQHNLLRDSSSPGSPDSSSKRQDRDSPSSHAALGGNGSSPDLRHFDADSDEFDRVPSSLPFLSGFSLDGGHSATLTPMHLRKAKLMFFWVRYPSSAILKMYFPDIKFNKNNTAQLVKWFSNFREFFYIQMEKYARQALSEGIKNSEDLHVTLESELYRVINLHYNRNNHIEVPARFRWVVEQTLCEFFKAIQIGKDSDPSWKKQIYKVIARLDDYVPEYFKSQTFLDQLE